MGTLHLFFLHSKKDRLSFEKTVNSYLNICRDGVCHASALTSFVEFRSNNIAISILFFIFTMQTLLIIKNNYDEKSARHLKQKSYFGTGSCVINNVVWIFCNNGIKTE